MLSIGHERFWAKIIAVSEALFAVLLSIVKVLGRCFPISIETKWASCIPLLAKGRSLSRSGAFQLDFPCRINIKFFINDNLKN